MHTAVNPLLRPLLLLVLLLAACTPARREIGRNMDAVRRIQFEGNGTYFSGHNDLQLRQQLEQGASRPGLTTWPLMYWVDPVVLDDDALLRDAYRLEVWYAHHGWFDARFLGWEVRRVRAQGRRQGGVVDVLGSVEPGKPSFVRSIALTGLDKPRFRTLKDAVLRDRQVREGDQFDLSYAEADRALILDLLYGTGFPYADVRLDVRADPAAREVDIVYAADTGIHARFGPTEIVGLDRVREDQVRARLTYEPRREYQVDRLRETQAALLDMGTFSSVRVEPILDDPTRKDVPIRISVSESRWRTLRLGVGSSVQRVFQATDPDSALLTEGAIFDGLAWSPRLSARFQHANLFRQLIRWELYATAGVYYEPQPPEDPVDNQGRACLAKLVGALQDPTDPQPRLQDACPHTLEPTWTLGTTASWPRILGERWGLEYTGLLAREVFLGDFPLRRIESGIAAVHQPARTVQLRVGPTVETARYYFVPGGAQERRLKKVYGTGFDNPYTLVALDQRLTVDRRTAKRRTKVVRGLAYAAAGLRETLPVSETAQRFIGIDLDSRYWFPIPVGDRGYQLMSAFAFRGGYRLPYSSRDIAYPERVFLGGANSVRGFRTGQLGPYDAFVDPDDGSITFISRGGTLALQGSAELRLPWRYGVTWATFVDAGTLSEGFSNFGAATFRYSAGVGMRYDTLVGPLRLDLSFRPIFPEDRGPAAIYPENAELNSVRRYDFYSGLFPNAEREPPFAMVVFLAIGEAI